MCPIGRALLTPAARKLNGYWILDFGFSIAQRGLFKSKIENRKSKMHSLW